MKFQKDDAFFQSIYTLGRCGLYDGFDPQTCKTGRRIGLVDAVELEVIGYWTDYGADADNMPADVDDLQRVTRRRALLQGIFVGEPPATVPGKDVWIVTELPGEPRTAVLLRHPAWERALHVCGGGAVRRGAFALRARVRLEEPYGEACEVWNEVVDTEDEEEQI